MEKPTLQEFHLAMYSKYTTISFEQVLELYLQEYPEEKNNPLSDPATKTESESKTKKKSKK
jgi:hypothetical protein